MRTCCCSLAGTRACLTCSNGAMYNQPTRTYTHNPITLEDGSQQWKDLHLLTNTEYNEIKQDIKELKNNKIIDFIDKKIDNLNTKKLMEEMFSNDKEVKKIKDKINLLEEIKGDIQNGKI